MTEPQDFVTRELPRFQEEMFAFLRIPSVSMRSEHDGDTRTAARWLADAMKDAGLAAEVLDTPRHPIVLGEWRGAGDDEPTILIYGHYDVQPVEPLDLWESPPFEPDVRGDRIYCRGIADDKGQLFLHVKALEAHLATRGNLPVNVIFLAEGEEEIGSPSLVPFVREHRARLACDAVVISDTSMFSPELPSLLFSLRGIAYFEVHVQGPSSDLHSGSYGGAVVNPAVALARMIGTLHDDAGRIAIEGFFDDVMDWDESTRRAIRDLPFTEDGFRAEVGAPALGGERGYTTLERLWIRPTCDVNGMLSGYTGEGSKTVLPASAMAKISFRLVPDQSPERVEALVKEHFRKVAPPGVTVAVQHLHGGYPWKAETGGPLMDAAGTALEAAFGTRPVLVGEGGSIPIVVDFQRILGAQCLLVGFCHPTSNIHAPNEWFPLGNVEKGIRTLVRLYEEIGQSERAG
jgi:acetylornithine deacetylase/succinyl-diaminopimelate desuccinylase-like protein